MRGSLWVAVVVAGCTAPNPNVGEGSDSEADGSTSTSASSATSTSPTASSSTSSTSPTSGATEMTTSDSDPTAGSGTSCPPTHRCVTAPPEGWLGPVAVAETVLEVEQRPDCITEYPDVAVELFDGLDDPDPICTCSCADPTGVSCPTPILEYYGSNALCMVLANSWSVSGCVAINGTASDRYWRVPELPVQGGNCNPMFSEEVPDASWSVAWTACGGATVLEGCDADTVCAPVPGLPLEPNLCIYRNGVHDCPEGTFTERLLYYEQIGDTRGCTQCECGDPEGLCSGTVRTFQGSGCSSTLTNQFFPTGNCVNGSAGTVASANYDNDGPQDPTCPASGGQPTGNTSPTLPRTFCCETGEG